MLTIHNVSHKQTITYTISMIPLIIVLQSIRLSIDYLYIIYLRLIYRLIPLIYKKISDTPPLTSPIYNVQPTSHNPLHTLEFSYHYHTLPKILSSSTNLTIKFLT